MEKIWHFRLFSSEVLMVVSVLIQNLSNFNINAFAKLFRNKYLKEIFCIFGPKKSSFFRLLIRSSSRKLWRSITKRAMVTMWPEVADTFMTWMKFSEELKKKRKRLWWRGRLILWSCNNRLRVSHKLVLSTLKANEPN